MIRVQLSFEGNKDKDTDFEVVEGELLSSAIERVLVEVPLNGRKHSEVFNAVVNGLVIHSDFWAVTSLKKSDSVLISPSIKSGESGQIFKTVALIAITAVASVVLTPAGGATLFSTLAVAGVTIAASLALNALIPPPVPGGLNEFGPDNVASSQMYAISGQSNEVRKFQTVPKVYGTHRMFPAVAARPYTDLEADGKGGTAQYLYAIYDFGIGPAYVSNLAIGDTPLTGDNFTDFSYNFVDPNRPDVSEGIWDDNLQKEFTIYRGDFEGEQVGVALNGNRLLGSAPADYQTQRNTNANTGSLPQEITLNFINPEGLYAFTAGGVRGPREIRLDIEFSKVGEDVWKKYNDLNYVSAYAAIGTGASPIDIQAPGPNGNTFFSVAFDGYRAEGSSIYSNLPNKVNAGRFRELVFKPGYNFVPLNVDALFTAPDPQLGLFYDQTFMGQVIALDVPSGPVLPAPYVSVFVLPNPPGLLAFVYFFDEVANDWILVDSPANYRIKTSPSIPGQAKIRSLNTTPVYSTFKFTPREVGQFKVRVTRETTLDPFVSGFNINPADKLTWAALSTRLNRKTIVPETRHVFLELKIRATGQLNGQIQNLSGIVSSVLDVYDENTQTWSKEISSNPAWVVADLITGEVNKKALPKSRLHLPSLLEWADFCDAVPTPPPAQTYIDSRFSCNFVLDYSATLQTVLGQVTGAGQASLNIIDGKYGVLIDRLQSTPVQIFTPRNSKDFSSSRIYTSRPHALKVKFIDPSLNWEVSEVLAYDEGYSDLNATEFEEITTFGCTSQEQAWRFGRYMIAQNKLRQETIGLTVDFEHLVCTRGDFVQITQDVMRVGGTPARVKSISGSIVEINEALDINPMLSYGYVIRNVEFGIQTSTLTVVDSTHFDLDGIMPVVGDLIIIGEVGSIVFNCIVKSISPNSDLSATITLVEKNDAIYEYESLGSVPDYDPQIAETSDPNFAPSKVQNLVVADVGHECANNSTYEYFVDLVWDVPVGSVYEYFEVYVDPGTGFEFDGRTKTTLYRAIVDTINLGAEHSFKVVAVAASGKKLDLGSVDTVTATPLSKTEPPSSVESLSADVTNEVLQLFWPQIPDCDAREYLIRYTPVVGTSTWESSIPLLRVDRNVTLASTQARTGTYLIKAIDFNGNESATAARAITTIPSLANLNIIEEISDSPTFTGELDRTVVTSGSLYLENSSPGVYYSEGYYYYTELLDLGEIYTVRLQSLIQAEGYSEGDLMANWITLDAVPYLSSTLFSEWAIETQYRSTENLNVIADWTTLDSIVLLNEGAAENFSPWRSFYMGDATARIFQFRLKLLSNKAGVTPRVFDATIRADMPDRSEAYNNLLVDAVDGLEVLYNPSFKGPGTSPNIQVTLEDAESGDYWSFDYRSLDGFLIRVFDKNDVQVERTIDVHVRGYGRKYTSAI